MKLRVLLVTMVAAVVAFGWTAVGAKGAQRLTVSGPGLAAPIRLTNSAEAPISVERIALSAGLFKHPGERVLAGRPSGALGPRYVARYDWLVAQGTTAPLRQELFPFVDGGAIVHTPPGQRIGGGARPAGRWHQAGTKLTMLLVAAGVPVPPSYVMPVPVVHAPRLTG
jgi:hypothetical protein